MFKDLGAPTCATWLVKPFESEISETSLKSTLNNNFSENYKVLHIGE